MQFWDRTIQNDVQSWSIDEAGIVSLFSTSIEDMQNPNRLIRRFAVLNISKLMMAKAGCVSIMIDHDGVHITVKMDDEIEKHVGEFARSLANEAIFSVKHFPSDDIKQPAQILLDELTVTGLLTLPLNAFFIPATSEVSHFDGWVKLVNSIQKALKINWTSSLHQSTAINNDHRNYLCSMFYAFITNNLTSVSPTNNAQEFDHDRIDGLAFQGGAVVVVESIREWDEKNFRKHGNIRDLQNLLIAKFPFSYQFIGDPRNRKGSLTCIPIQHMFTPREEERSRQLSDIHVDDVEASLALSTESGTWILNVELTNGKQSFKLHKTKTHDCRDDNQRLGASWPG